MPHPFVVRAALEQSTPGRSLSAILGAERACSIHYLCADRAGLLYRWRLRPPNGTLLEPDGEGYMSIPIISLAPRFQPMETREFRIAGAHTIVRLKRARQLLKRLGQQQIRLTTSTSWLTVTIIRSLSVAVMTVMYALLRLLNAYLIQNTGQTFFARGDDNLAEVTEADCVIRTSRLKV